MATAARGAVQEGGVQGECHTLLNLRKTIIGFYYNNAPKNTFDMGKNMSDVEKNISDMGKTTSDFFPLEIYVI